MKENDSTEQDIGANRLAQIKKRLETLNLAAANIQELSKEDSIRCPMCEGEGMVDSAIVDYNFIAAGIQAFGIGDDLEAMEQFVKHAHDDITYLLNLVEKNLIINLAPKEA